MIELTQDRDYEKVKCPNCRHTWWEKIAGVSVWFDRGKIKCPKCHTPLILPNPIQFINSQKETQ